LTRLSPHSLSSHNSWWVCKPELVGHTCVWHVHPFSSHWASCYMTTPVPRAFMSPCTCVQVSKNAELTLKLKTVGTHEIAASTPSARPQQQMDASTAFSVPCQLWHALPVRSCLARNAHPPILPRACRVRPRCLSSRT
jgi:hypothetical protein